MSESEEDKSSICLLGKVLSRCSSRRERYDLIVKQNSCLVCEFIMTSLTPRNSFHPLSSNKLDKAAEKSLKVTKNLGTILSIEIPIKFRWDTG